MSPTLEKAKPARRSRLEIVDEALAADETALQAARAKFVELAAAEDAAVQEAKHADPGASPYGLRSPAQLIRDEREKLERSISGLERGITALKSERAAAASEQASRELGEHVKHARRLAGRERELRQAAGEAFSELVTRWNALADVLSERSALAVEVARADLVKRVDRAAAEAWEEAAAFVVQPVPIDFRAFFNEALAATTGERPDDDDGGSLVSLNKTRAELGLVPEQRHVSAAARELSDCYPDLRGEVRSAEVNGAPIRRSAGPESGGWGEAA
jgi:hypothetical protein